MPRQSLSSDAGLLAMRLDGMSRRYSPCLMSALPLIADEQQTFREVRLEPITDFGRVVWLRPVAALETEIQRSLNSASNAGSLPAQPRLRRFQFRPGRMSQTFQQCGAGGGHHFGERRRGRSIERRAMRHSVDSRPIAIRRNRTWRSRFLGRL